MDLNLCLDAVPAFLGFFDLSVAPPLLFYAYIPILVLSILFSLFILAKSPNKVLSRYFFGITISFAAWIFLILFQWMGAYLETVHLAWQLLIIPEISIYVFAVLFTYAFIFGKDVPDWSKYGLALIFVAAAAIMPTTLNITSFDLTYCEGVIGAAWPWTYVFELLNIALVVLIAFERLLSKIPKQDKLKNFLFAVGVVFFLAIFWLSNYFGELTQTYEFNLVGPVGMALFLGLLTYTIVRFETFSIKLIATQALVWGLIVLIGSQFFFIQNPTNKILNSVTFVGAIIFGYWLTKSVKREIQQKERLSELNINLRDLIKQRESLVHLVTHKVKGSFTRTKLIFAGLLDGTFGDINPEVKKIAEKGLEFDNGGIETVDLVLNAANLESGLIKYEMKEVDFEEIVKKTADEKKLGADNKGLKLITEFKDGKYKVLGDAFWLKEVVNNLIENSIKYTKEGTITVELENEKGKALLSVKDTGLGISDEDKKNLFTEGGRGKNSVKVNVDSTGYGLYTVKMVVEAHKGTVWAESAGENKGSQFYVELPLA